MGSAISLYLFIGSACGLVFIVWLYWLSKKFDNTPVENDEEYRGREDISRAWDNIENVTRSTAMAAVFVFATCVLIWPLMILLWIKVILGR